MKITEKDLYNEDGRIHLCEMPNYRGKKNMCIYIKKINAWVSLVTLVNTFLKQTEHKE